MILGDQALMSSESNPDSHRRTTMGLYSHPSTPPSPRIPPPNPSPLRSLTHPASHGFGPKATHPALVILRFSGPRLLALSFFAMVSFNAEEREP